MRKKIMDMHIDDLTLAEAVEAAMGFMDRGEYCRVVTPNAEFALRAGKQPDFLKVLNSSQLIIPDGISVVLAAKIIGSPLKGKVSGVDFSQAMFEAMACKGKRLYILGCKPGVAQRAADNMADKHKGIVIAGVQDGFYSLDQEEDIVEQIAAAAPDFLVVALGSPRQEFFMEKYRAKLPCVMVGNGGAVDIFAGDTPRAPDIFIRLGLEWLHRLIIEPSRINRIAKLPLYLLRAVGFRLRHGKQREVS